VFLQDLGADLYVENDEDRLDLVDSRSSFPKKSVLDNLSKVTKLKCF